ncbi:serine hydrolase domain-containing protein [Thermomonas fusca]
MNLNRRELLATGIGLAGSFLAPSALGVAASAPGMGMNSRLVEITATAVTSKSTPSVALAVWRNGKETFSSYTGHANLETGTPVTANSIFRIGSLTKQFTAAMVLKLAAQGKLSLDDKAQSYLSFLDRHEAFTLAELLHHTAGVHDNDEAPVGPLSQLELAKHLAGMEPFFDFRPGTAWRYSNAGYIMVGAVIEEVTGMPLAMAAATLLFEPLGLVDTAFDAVGDVVSGRVSGYTPTGDAITPFRNADFMDIALTGGSGAMRSTASDLCRWHHLLFRGDVLPLPLVQTMLTAGRLRNGAVSGSNRQDPQAQSMGDVQYGYGLMLDTHTIDHRPIAAHHGGVFGFAAYLASHPSTGLTYACLCNADTHPGLPLRDIRRQVLAGVLA